MTDKSCIGRAADKGFKTVRKTFTSLEVYYVAAALAIFVYVLFVEKAGIADNGDFNRILTPLFMDYPKDLTYNQLYFDFVNSEYAIINPFPSVIPIYLNTHILFVYIAKLLNVVLYSKELFKTAFLSGVYTVAFLYAFYLVLIALKSDKPWLNFINYTLALLVLTDRGNMLYFGSLYAEPAAFVSFVTAVGMFMYMLKYDKFTIFNISVLFASLTLFLGAKVQYAPLSLLFLPFIFFLIKYVKEKKAKNFIKLWATVMMVITLGIYLIQPMYLDEVTTFDSVFCGILVGDEEADKSALNELGISEEYYLLAGMDGFENEYPIDIYSEDFRAGFYDKVGKADIVFYYLKHFDRLWENLEKTAEVSFINLPEYLGNRTEDFSEVRQSYGKFKFYDSFKKAVLPRNIVFVMAFFVLYFAVELYFALKSEKSRRRIKNIFIMTLIAFCGIQFVLPTVGNGGIDIAKQLYMFNVIFDLLLLNAFCSLVLSKKIRFWRN